MSAPKLEPKRVVCVACNRVIVASKNGHPRRHSPHTRLAPGHPLTRGTCGGTFDPGTDPAEPESARTWGTYPGKSKEAKQQK